MAHGSTIQQNVSWNLYEVVFFFTFFPFLGIIANAQCPFLLSIYYFMMKIVTGTDCHRHCFSIERIYLTNKTVSEACAKICVGT